MAKVGEVAKSAESGEPVFTLMDVVLYRRPIFKQKKGSTTISLGLNYCSMGSCLSLFGYTVPLSLAGKSSGGYNNTNIDQKYFLQIRDFSLQVT
jgi:hypothetical protein